jgi:hypothetical protein
LTAKETWDELWKLIMGSSPIGEVLRAVIFYVLVLLVADIVALINTTYGALLTLLLIVFSVGDFIKTSEASFWNLWKRVPSTIATTIVARLLGQDLDYAFGIIFFVFLFIAAVEHFFPDSPPAKRRRKRRKS